ncbi:MAG TPA: type IV pilus assembly protein PilM [bacterium]|jgi:type IV pilus assembly protein PilM|nr:type IV pilus assembly protein PilM [bacterium]HOG38117.1 type IV pilus assembly protein PilM [bacterium]HQI03173.1 type IV pilus assembly protein PilM [bacterium]
MGLFSKKNQNFLGVDIGTSGIKLVQLANEKGTARLVTYGLAEINTEIIRNKTTQNINIVAGRLAGLVQKSRVSTKDCSAALPIFSVFNSVISLPAMSKNDMDSAVKWEAKKFIPFPIEDMILDWRVIADTQNKHQTIYNEKSYGSTSNSIDQDIIKTKSKFIKVLLTAAPKNVVAVYIEIFKKAQLNLLSLEVESFAIARSLIDQNTNNVMVIDIGSVTTDVCVVENGLPILNRSIEVGGNLMTESIARSLNISFERAEQFKQDFGLATNLDEGISIPKKIEETLAPMVNEIKYVFDLYKRQSNSRIDSIILTGGSAYLPNLIDYLKKVLNAPVYIGDPWHKVMYPKELEPVLDEMGPKFGVAIGLALRNII